MHQIYVSKHQVLLYSEKDRLFISEWKRVAERPSREEYLEEVHKLYSYFASLSPLRYYNDISLLSYEMTAEDQAYVANLFKDVKASYCAVVTDKIYFDPTVEEVINKLEQMTEDFDTNYFFDRNKAMKWLLECGTKGIKNSKSSQEVSSQH